MTLLTPNFADKIKTLELQPLQTNGAAGTPVSVPVHIVQAHEPLKNEIPVSLLPGTVYQVPTEQKMNVAPVVEPQPLKVALVGTAPSSRLLAPYTDPSWKIWACSPGNMGALPRVDVWFELHGNLLWPECVSYGKPYIEWLKQQTFPIYMQDNSLVPNALTFPMRDMVSEFGPYGFTSSFAWMMAFAICQGAREVALYGIDMASRDEYIQQRQGGQFFLVEGAKRGVKIWAPYESDIMQPPGLYGYSDVTPFGRKIHARDKELADRITPLIQQRDSLNHQITYLQGAREDVDYFKSIQIGAQDNNTATEYLNRLIEKSRSQNGQG